MSDPARSAEKLTQSGTRWSGPPRSRMVDGPLLNALARALLAGEAAVEPMVARASETLGHQWRWLRPLALRYLAAMAGRTRPRRRDAVRFLLGDAGFRRAWARHADSLSVGRWLTEPQRMQPAPAAAAWDVPAIESAGALAEWLALTPAELDWFADLKGLGNKMARPALGHYHYRVLAKRSGRVRLIESPKPRLKQLQRRILSGILERVPAHPAAHGFLKGRSIRTFIAPHVGQRVVLRMDLQDFFPALPAARIEAFFRTAGYPETVAALLGGICTNSAPRCIWKEMPFEIEPQLLREERELYSRPHLPQGAPSSPALANSCAYRADCRLTGFAESVGARYTRYADDLAFSGGPEFESRAGQFPPYAAAILLEEGFPVNHRKTRIMRQGVRQHLAGLVANQRVNIPRGDFDRLKATLTNCVRLGPESQNREGHTAFRAHLEGRVSFVESIHPARGQRLRGLLEQVRWE